GQTDRMGFLALSVGPGDRQAQRRWEGVQAPTGHLRKYFPTWVRSGWVPLVVLDQCLPTSAVARTGACRRFARPAESERTGRVRPVAPSKDVRGYPVTTCLENK